MVRMSPTPVYVAWVSLLAVAALQILGQHVNTRKKGTPPLYAEVPDTSFRCSNHMVGYFADMEAQCQVYHMCDTLGRQYSYLCPNMTVFHQRFMVCDYWHLVNCSNSARFYDLNMRMAGGGQMLPQAGRLANLIEIDDNRRRNTIDIMDMKFSLRTGSNKRAMMKKKKMELLLNQRRTSGTTPRRQNTTPRRTTTTTSRPRITQRVRTTPQKTTRNTFLRPLTPTTKPPLRIARTKSKVRTTTRKPVSQSSVTTRSTPTSTRHVKTTTARPRSTTRRVPSAGSRTKPTSKITPFGVTEIRNFSELKRNQSSVPAVPFLQMLPGMVARGSGPRFGFGSANIMKPPPGHIDVLREFHNNPLFLEVSRQILLPRLNVQRFFFSSRPATSGGVTVPATIDSNSVAPTPIPIIPRSPTSTFIFPRRGNVVSFPIQPVIFDRNTTPKPIVMTGPRQEDITELQAKSNGRNRLSPVKQSHQISIHRSSVHGNQAFFIPETHLIPPDNIQITDDTASMKESHPQPGLIRQTESSTEDEDDDDDSHHHMTMIFPNSRKLNMNKRIGGLLLNPDCPECHPAFLTPGKCTPCVRIR